MGETTFCRHIADNFPKSLTPYEFYAFYEAKTIIQLPNLG